MNADYDDYQYNAKKMNMLLADILNNKINFNPIYKSAIFVLCIYFNWTATQIDLIAQGTLGIGGLNNDNLYNILIRKYNMACSVCNRL